MSVGSFGRPNPAANRPRGDSPVRVPVGQSGSSSSRGPWNPMMAPASVHLPLANSTQEDLEIFRGVEAALTDQAAQTQYQGTLATDADSTQHRYSPYALIQVPSVGLRVSEGAVGSTFPDTFPDTFPNTLPGTIPDTVPQYSMDDDAHVPTTVDDSFPCNQEAYVPSTQLDQVTPPSMAL